MAFLPILLLDLRTGFSCLATREYFWASETWRPGEDGAIRLRRTDCGSMWAPVGVEQLSGRMGASTRSCHGEAGEPAKSCGPGEACAILSLEADRLAPPPRPLGSWGVAIRELTVTDASLPVSGFWGVDSSSDIKMLWEAGAAATRDGVGEGARADLSRPRCSSALWRSLTPISTTGTSGPWARLFSGSLASTVGDSGVGEGAANATVAAAAAAAAARVTRRRTEPFSPTTVASFSTLSLLRRCRELSWLLRVLLRDNLLEAAEQRLRQPGGARGTPPPKIEQGAPVSPGATSLHGVGTGGLGGRRPAETRGRSSLSLSLLAYKLGYYQTSQNCWED